MMIILQSVICCVSVYGGYCGSRALDYWIEAEPRAGDYRVRLLSCGHKETESIGREMALKGCQSRRNC